jgi:uncharacterized membrane protein
MFKDYVTLGKALTSLDVIAVLWFGLAWVGYTYFSAWYARRAPSLHGVMDEVRRMWAQRMVERDNRMVDINIVRNLTRSSQFFASTTLLILGALLALMGYVQKAVDVMSELPFAVKASERLWEMKILLLVGVFVYAFFKFSWSIRQFGFCTVVVGATGTLGSNIEEHRLDMNRLALVVSFASSNFNQGLRAYYFGVAALAWFVHPWLLMVATAWVVWVLYAREFRSRTLSVLRTGLDRD